METLWMNLTFYLSISTLFTLSISSFSPVDNHLIDCGSTQDSTVDSRRFLPDSSAFRSPLFSSTRAISLRNENPFLGLPQIYHTARVFKRPSKYVLSIREQGTHLVRLHFHRFNSSKFDFNDAQFHVLVDGYVVLRNFSGENTLSPRIKEYLIWINTEKLVITFIPTKNSRFAFVNAIEVISAPKDLIADTAQFVNGNKIEKFDGLTKQALEMVYRVNVGGPKVTPFNDTLWRTWVPDDEFLKSGNGSKKIYFSGHIQYQVGGASREVGPDNVYNSARVITSTNASIPDANITLEFPTIEGYKYLVRMHFCDIASISLGLIYFNVYVNGYLAYKDLDLTHITYELASPFYADFVVDGDHSGVLSVSVGPSNKSMGYAVDAILNGAEIMKMNNSMGSLDGELSAELVLKSWPKGNIGVLVPLIAVVCLLISISLVIHRRMIGARDTVAWSKLLVNAPEVDSKHRNQQLSSKL